MADLWAQSRQNQQAQDAIQPPPPFVMPPMSSPAPLIFSQPAQGGRLPTPQEQNIAADTKALQCMCLAEYRCAMRQG